MTDRNGRVAHSPQVMRLAIQLEPLPNGLETIGEKPRIGAHVAPTERAGVVNSVAVDRGETRIQRRHAGSLVPHVLWWQWACSVGNGQVRVQRMSLLHELAICHVVLKAFLGRQCLTQLFDPSCTLRVALQGCTT